jgi:predicted ATP-dependent protease
MGKEESQSGKREVSFTAHVPWEKTRRTFRHEEVASGDINAGEIVGQDRARRAIEFGLQMEAHMFLVGPVGTGKTTYVIKRVSEWAKPKARGQDWCYVPNFHNPDQPRCLPMDAGMGRKFQDDVDQFVNMAWQQIRQAFDSDAYVHHRQGLLRQFQSEQQTLWNETTQKAKELGFLLQTAPTGALITVPLKPDGQPYHPHEFAELPEDIRQAIRERQEQLEEPIATLTLRIRALEREAKEALAQDDREVARNAAQHLLDLLSEQYQEHRPVWQYFRDVLDDLFQHLDNLRAEDGDQAASMPGVKGWLARYRVQVLVEHQSNGGAPVIVETNPTYANLFGHVDYQQVQGMLVATIEGIKAGSLLRANGGYLILNAADLLRDPFAYPALKRMLKQGWTRIENAPEVIGWLHPTLFQPEPIPITVTVILIGTADIYYALYTYDEDFRRLFKIKADFVADMPATRENLGAFRNLLNAVVERDHLLPLADGGAAALAEFGSYLAENQNRITARMGEILGVLFESQVWAAGENAPQIEDRHVKKALTERRYRSAGPEEIMQRLVSDGTLLLETEGRVSGQINGLAVMSAGDLPFGHPSRITVTTWAGERGIVNIERQTRQSGSTHTKGVLTLAGFFAGRFAQGAPLTLAASIGFEQMYNEVDGDSASSAELYALLSELADAGIDQGIAVTGSVDQKGSVQPIGGVNQKIEGFYRTCLAKGLSGKQGVIIPARNLKNLMVSDEVYDAVRSGQFHIWAVDHIDEGIELLTGMKAGTPGDGPDTIMGRVSERLRQYSRVLSSPRGRGNSVHDSNEEESQE